MKTRPWFLLLSGVVVIATCATPLLAAEHPTLFRGVRPLAMGGAFITVSDDENALLYNPAGLNNVTGLGGVELFNPYVSISDDGLGLYDDIQSVEGTDTVQVVNLLRQYMGTHQHAQAAMFPNVYMHNLAFGVLANGVMDLDIRNPAFPEVVTDARIDTAGLIGVAYGFVGGTVQVGATGKYVRREGVRKVYQPTDIVVEFDPLSDRSVATSFAADVGVTVKPPLAGRPSVALVVQNIGDLDFDSLGMIPQQIHVGVGVKPRIGSFASTVAVEVHDVTEQIDVDDDLYKRVHLGAELQMTNVIAVQAGVNQGYFTAGATVDFGILRLSGATYAEELGVVAGQRADRRYVVQLALGF